MPKGYKLLKKPKFKCKTCGIVKQVRDNWTAHHRKFCSRKCMRHTDITKRRIQQKKIGQHFHSEKWKKILRKQMKGNKFAVGHKLSDQHKQAIIDAHKGRKSHFWKDGRCQNPKYLSWISNLHSKRKQQAEGSHTFGEWELLKKQYGYICPMCKKSEPEIKLTEDHKIPLSKKGSDDISNIQPLCLKCNMKKHDKLPVENQ